MKWIAKLGDSNDILYRTEFQAKDTEEAFEIAREILEDYVKDHFENVNIDELFFNDFSEPNFICVDVSIPVCDFCPDRESCNQDNFCEYAYETYFIEAYPEE